MKFNDLRKEFLKIIEESKDYKELYLRTLADFKNYKKRQIEEMEKIKDLIKGDIILKIIPIIDNFERAMCFEMNDNNFESIKKGIEMIYKQFLNILEKEGVKQFSSIGKKFDPSKHEAIGIAYDDSKEEDTILDEVEKGYYYKDTLLRPAKVIVSKKMKKEGGDENG